MTTRIYSRMLPMKRSTISRVETILMNRGLRLSHGLDGRYHVMSYDMKKCVFADSDIEKVYEHLMSTET